MKYLSTTLLLILPLGACQTSSGSHDTPPPVTETAVHCSIKLLNEKSPRLGDLIVEAHFSSVPNSQVLIAVKRANQSLPNITTADISIDDKIKFNANSTDVLEIDVHNLKRLAEKKTVDEQGATVSISEMTSGSDLTNTVPCIYFTKISLDPNANIASCNAQGTPAAGWYHDGRIVKLSANCNRELLSCGRGQNSGWFLQKKKNLVLVKQEKCSWMKNSPKCVSKSSFAGWHIGNRLVSRDDLCEYKHIECREHGTKKEGWYIFEHTKPELLLSETCHPNQKTADLGQ